MKKVLASLAALSVVVGVWVAHDRGWGSSKVTALVENGTPEVAQAIVLQVDTCHDRKAVSVGALNPGGSRRIQYTVCGEGGYTVQAQLASGRMIEGGGGYTEAGYRTTDSILADRIVSKQETY